VVEQAQAAVRAEVGLAILHVYSALAARADVLGHARLEFMPLRIE
jgi:hypothetical protein